MSDESLRAAAVRESLSNHPTVQRRGVQTLDLLDRLARAEGAVARACVLAEDWDRTDLGTDRLCSADLRAALDLGDVAGNAAEACVEAPRSDEQGSGGVVGRAGMGAGS